MRRPLLLSLLFGVLLGGWLVHQQPVSAAVLLEGKVVQTPAGSWWYVSPRNHLRYWLGRTSTSALKAFQATALGVTNANLFKIPASGSTATGDAALQTRLAGYILLQVEAQGKIWYVTPVTKQRIVLDGSSGAFAIMAKVGVRVTTAALLAYTAAAGFDVPKAAPKPINGLLHSVQNVSTTRGTFSVDLLTLDRTVSTAKVMTDTGQLNDCANNCQTFSLGTYVTRRGGVAGIHGTYFCPPEYASCVGQTGSYLYPVYNTFSKVMVNADRMKYTSQPIVVFDTDNQPFFYSTTLKFHSLPELQTQLAIDAKAIGSSGILRAAISNGPAMVEAGRNTLNLALLDTKQATVHGNRGGLGWKGTTLYFFVVHGATVTDSASVAQALGLDYAINLDGGGSTAMYLNGSYLLGPGRNLPNAIVFQP